MISSIEIYTKLGEYLSNQISISELEYWLVRIAPIYLENTDSPIIELIGLIELGFAEINAGIRSERGFKYLLKKYPGTKVNTALKSNPFEISSSTTLSLNNSTFITGSPFVKESQPWHNELQVANV